MTESDAPCTTCGWPPSYAVHHDDNRGRSFVTAEGIRNSFVKGHPHTTRVQAVESG